MVAALAAAVSLAGAAAALAVAHLLAAAAGASAAIVTAVRHVNPFEIVSITDEDGRDRTDPKGPAYDPDYEGLIGQWKDTVLVKENDRVIFRTRYERFTGDFVMAAISRIWTPI